VIYVQIIKPSGGRFELRFGDNATDVQIMAAVRANRYVYGRSRKIKKPSPDPNLGSHITVEDPASPYATDDPETIVTIGRPIENGFAEFRRLAGPPLEGDAPTIAGKVG